MLTLVAVLKPVSNFLHSLASKLVYLSIYSYVKIQEFALIAV